VTRDGWRLAVGTLTALRVRPPGSVDATTARTAMLLAPLAVLPLAAVVVAVGIAGAWTGLPAPVCGLLAVGTLAAGSRALHLDGLSDTVDGLTASYDAERSLRVMKSGTAGPAGVVALVVVLGLQAAALGALLAEWRGAVLAGVAVCVSRCALAVCCSRGVPAARADGLGVTYTQTVPRSGTGAVWTAATVVLAVAAHVAGLPWWRGVVAALVAVVVVLAVVRRAVRRFGGVTGDVFGAAVELTLAALLVALT
jgi:adenosylcobinamide-GDP ribazoletransferase